MRNGCCGGHSVKCFNFLIRKEIGGGREFTSLVLHLTAWTGAIKLFLRCYLRFGKSKLVRSSARNISSIVFCLTIGQLIIFSKYLSKLADIFGRTKRSSLVCQSGVKRFYEI
jgi:hypothetical protein